jgi:phosphate starvation-inducible membrane PsiE
MPVRFLIYVAITALTRLLIEVINKTHDANLTVIIITAAILLLAFSQLILRYSSLKFPIAEGPEEIADRPSRRGKKKSGATV